MAGLVLLSAGGTGGHLFPAEALAHELRARGHAVHLVTDRRAERFAGSFPADEIHVVASATITSKNPIALMRTGLALFRGLRESGRLLARLRPAVVVGFGGYPTLPPLMGAARAGIPAMIQEQNAVMGRANRFLAGRVNRIAGGFLKPEGAFADKIVTTGNPVRPDVLKAAQTPYDPLAAEGPFRLLVFGGSQGARFFSEVMPATIDLLPEELRTRLKLTQQARPEDLESVQKHYRETGIEAEISPFFNNMAERLAAAHLIISRSGASTVSEIAVVGRPAILVPFPHALDHDQAANAAALEAQGGARVVQQSELSPQTLASMLQDFASRPDDLAAMAANAKSVGSPDAARLLADLVEDMAGDRTSSQQQEAMQ